MLLLRQALLAVLPTLAATPGSGTATSPIPTRPRPAPEPPSLEEGEPR
jgi:hypothetical protein